MAQNLGCGYTMPKAETRFRGRGGCAAGLVAAICICHIGLTGAENLPDPTRPPATVAGTGTAGAPAVPSGPVLQSVLIASKRRAAIISGETVELGGKYQDAQLIRLSEGEAVLKTGQGLQTLKLFPQVEKRVAIQKPDKARVRKPSVPAPKSTEGQK